MRLGSEDADPEGIDDADVREAYRVLDTLVAIRHIAPAAGDAARARFDRLCAAAQAAAQRQVELAGAEQELLRKVAESGKEAREAQRHAEEYEGISIQVLREDVEAAQSEATLANERCSLLELEAGEVRRQRDDLAEHLEHAAEEHAAALRPLIERLREESAALSAAVDSNRASAAAAAAGLEAERAREAALEGEVQGLRRTHRAEANRLLGVQANPEKARRQADLASAETSSARQLLVAAEAKLLEAEAAARGADERERQQQALHVAALAALERARILAEGRGRLVADVARDRELAAAEAERALGDGAELDMRLRALQAEARTARLAAASARRDRDAALRSLQSVIAAADSAASGLPELRTAVAAVGRDVVGAREAVIAARKGAVALQKEVDLKLVAVLQEETEGNDKTALLDLTRQELVVLESDLAALKEEDRGRSRLLADMTAQRDRAARLVARNQWRLKEVLGAARTRGREVEEMRQVRAEVTRRSRDFGKLYDLVRNQRNRFVALIAAAGQARREMGERLRLLEAEGDVLRGEAGERARLVAKAKQLRLAAVVARDTTRGELHSLAAAFRSRHEALAEGAAATAAARAQVAREGAAMAGAAERYKGAVEARNATGLMVVDRADEIAVLCERWHALEGRLTEGRVALQQRDGEIRSLHLQVAELERSVAATRAALPDVAGIDKEVAGIKAALFMAQREAGALSLRLEDPSEPGRHRQLGGRIPDREELVAKLQTLEERLGMKREEAAAKGAVLEEVCVLTEELREQAAATREAAAEASHAASEEQRRLRRAAGRLAAAIAELSLLQATALRLDAEREALRELVAGARQRLEEGLPPTDDAEAELARRERDAATLLETQRRREEEAAALDAKGALLETTAPPRPNAYVPEDIAIPRPFPAPFAPFRPATPGATMRHMRAPVAQEVVI